MWIFCIGFIDFMFKGNSLTDFTNIYIYKNELDKACFEHDMAYGDSDKFLKDKAFNIAKNPKYDGYQRRLASMVYKLFDKKNRFTCR